MADLVENNQIAAAVIPNSSGRLANGTFAPGNKISVGNGSAAGYARPSRRLESLLNEMTAAEIQEKISSGKILNLKGIDAMNLHKINKAATGDDAATAFVYDKLEPREQSSAVRVNVNQTSATAIQTDATTMLLELSQKITGDGDV